MVLWLVIGAALALALVVFVVVDQGRARAAHLSLRETAEKMGALPIASLRNGAQILLLRGEVGGSDTPFLMQRDGEVTRLSAAEIRRMWNRGRLWWYYSSESPMLGLYYYHRYLEGAYAPACRIPVPAGSCAVVTDGSEQETPGDSVT